MNADSCIEEEIKEKIVAGSRAYHVHKRTIHIKTNILKCRTTTLYHLNNSPNSHLRFRNMGT